MCRTIKSKIILLLVIISLLICASAIYAFADTEAPEIEYTTVASHYFNEIKDDIPYNHHDSCGYVAMSMLLAFYDVYWSDLFVNEEFENSIKPSASNTTDLDRLKVPELNLENSLLTETEKEDISAYRMFIQNNADEYLHMRLLSYGIEKNYHSIGEDNSGITDDFGITIKETGTILDAYFDDIFGDGDYYLEDGDYPENSSITIHTISEGKNGKTKQDVLDKIKEQVNKGIPVIYLAQKVLSTDEETTSRSSSETIKVGHYMIAYYADDDILLHTGHVLDPYTTYNNTEYKFDIEALWIEINEDVMPHRCSDTFNWYATGEGACSCDAYGTLHPEHVCKPANGYSVCPSAALTNVCYCGNLINGSHAYSDVRYDDVEHWYECACGDKDGIEAHDITYTSYDNTTHSGYCNGCGYTFTSTAHTYSYKCTTDLYHTCTCPCGKKKTEMHTKRAVDNRYAACRECDHVFDTWNDHMILKREDEETVE